MRDELIMLGAKNVRAQDARVFFEADRALIIKANLWLRCADRVFVQLGTCKAKTFTELFDGVRALDWRHLLPADAAFTVTGKSALSKLGSVRDVQSISKKAIADALMAAYGYARCPETGQAYNIEIGLLRDEATIAMNTSGPGLNRRGYREHLYGKRWAPRWPCYRITMGEKHWSIPAADRVQLSSKRRCWRPA